MSDLHRQMQVNQEQLKEIQALRVTVKTLEDSGAYLNRQLVRHIQEKHDVMKRCEATEEALA